MKKPTQKQLMERKLQSQKLLKLRKKLLKLIQSKDLSIQESLDYLAGINRTLEGSWTSYKDTLAEKTKISKLKLQNRLNDGLKAQVDYLEAEKPEGWEKMLQSKKDLHEFQTHIFASADSDAVVMDMSEALNSILGEIQMEVQLKFIDTPLSKLKLKALNDEKA